MAGPLTAVISMPSQLFTLPNRFGAVLNGSIYIGEIDKDPTQAANQIPVYVEDEAGNAIRVPQPIKINGGGYPSYNGQPAKFTTAQGHSMVVLDSLGVQQFYFPNVLRFNPDQMEGQLGGPTGWSYIGKVGSWSALKSLKPSYDGMRVLLDSYRARTAAGVGGGGGEFIGYLKAGTDDGGTICAGTGYYWQRVVDDEGKLTVLDFGAYTDDGATDSQPAITAMFRWAQANNPRVGIQFPAGKFKASGLDIASAGEISIFRAVGAGTHTAFGYMPTTEIVGDQGSGWIFNIFARYTEIGSFIWNGERNIKANTKGFLNNICPGGQFNRGNNLRIRWSGGVFWNFLDSLDMKVDQFYSERCNDSILRGRPSGQVAGNWNHLTAIELSNFNIQYSTGDGDALDLPKAGQSLIWNGWIEHTTNPANLSNGQWIVDAFSVEDCANPIKANYFRGIVRQNNLQSGSRWDYTAGDQSPLLSGWEYGRSRIENFGAYFTGSLDFGFLSSQQKIQNNVNGFQWVRLGSLFIPDQGDTVEIEVLGTQQYDLVSTLKMVGGTNQGGGKAVIRMQRKASGRIDMSWHGEGSCPLAAVMYSYPENAFNSPVVYIQLGNYVRNTICFVKTTSKDRYQAGQCFRWRFDGANVTRAEIDAEANATVAKNQTSFGIYNGAGFGYSDDGNLVLGGVTTGDGKMQFYMKGDLYTFPITKV